MNNYSDTKLGGKRLTFFTTGTVARTMPDLIKQMTEDGHEVGSHYNFHDLMYKQSNYEIAKNLEISKDIYSINPDTGEVRQLVNRTFAGDESSQAELKKSFTSIASGFKSLGKSSAEIDKILEDNKNPLAN